MYFILNKKLSLAQPFADLWTVKSLEQWGSQVISSRERGGGWRESSLENACPHLSSYTWSDTGHVRSCTKEMHRAYHCRQMHTAWQGCFECGPSAGSSPPAPAPGLSASSRQQLLPWRVLPAGMGTVEEQQQQSEAHSKCLRLSRAPLGIYQWIMSLPSQSQK